MAVAGTSEVGGYEYTFIETPHHRYVCNICIHPCRDPYLTGCCGHNFCKYCLDDYRKTAIPCPCCHNENFITVINKQADREIRSLHLMCTNKERGCEWQGELNDVNNHLGNIDGCQFEDVKCFNECGKTLQRRYLTSHVETECSNCHVECQYCHISGGNQFIEGEHKEQCPKLPLACPNNCKVSCPRRKSRKRRARSVANALQYFPREEIEAHRKECPLEMVQCLNKCEKELQRRYLSRHVQTLCPRRKVDCQYCHVTGEHKFIKIEHEEKCPKRPLQCPNNCEVESILTEEMEAHRKECPLEMVVCEYHSVGCEEKVTRKRKREHEKEEMEKHLLLTKNMLNTSLKKIDNLMVVLNQTITSQYHHSTTSVIGTASTVSEAKWSVRLAAMTAMVKSGHQVCPVGMIVTDFAKKVCFKSHTFYTHDKGYKMRLVVYPAGSGDGKGTHLSVFLYLMKGPHDDKLSWPLRGKFKFTLLNQTSDCEHHSENIIFDDGTSDNITSRVSVGERSAYGWGHPKFVSNEDLHRVTSTRQYLKDDCIFLQIRKL
ncbi:TNF receptor-associated factor 4-like [Dysidea avara]|uniref:TNF receptor-associated factor 4-like n=1 Tax=Dysidea avara TaxID=196820 RepID=UPI0033250403